MRGDRLFFAALVGTASVLGGCSASTSSSMSTNQDVVVATDTPLEKAQQAANAAFANSYAPKCVSDTDLPRVLIAGYGHFDQIVDNATGEMVHALVPGATYPSTVGQPGQVEDPATQTSVALGTVTLPSFGDVQVCAMIVPVYWDLAAILVAKEADAYAPNFVLMNGVADDTQPIWLELGSVNEALQAPEGSQNLSPVSTSDGKLPPLIPTAGAQDFARPLLASWSSIHAGALAAVKAQALVTEGDTTFSSLTNDVVFAGFPRESNTYLCNNITYTVGYLMDHPGESVELLQPSTGGPGVTVTINTDMRAVPREFVHWPSTMHGALVGAGAEVMKAIVDAQISSLANGETPTRGDNANADPSLVGGNPNN